MHRHTTFMCQAHVEVTLEPPAKGAGACEEACRVWVWVNEKWLLFEGAAAAAAAALHEKTDSGTCTAAATPLVGLSVMTPTERYHPWFKQKENASLQKTMSVRRGSTRTRRGLCTPAAHKKKTPDLSSLGRAPACVPC